VWSKGRLIIGGDDGSGTELWALDSPAAAIPYGIGCAGTGGRVPRLAGDGGAPALGNLGFGARLSRTRANAPAVCLLGHTEREQPLGSGCWLNVDGLLLLPFLTTGAAGEAVQPLPVPNDAVLLGAVVLSQFGIIDPAGTHYGILSMTSGLRIVIAAR
jgi:hypothetical protein